MGGTERKPAEEEAFLSFGSVLVFVPHSPPHSADSALKVGAKIWTLG
jgi:hypothetical protein